MQFHELDARLQAQVWIAGSEDDRWPMNARLEAAHNAITILWSELAAADMKIMKGSALNVLSNDSSSSRRCESCAGSAQDSGRSEGGIGDGPRLRFRFQEVRR
jgi:hypothetical protein